MDPCAPTAFRVSSFIGQYLHERPKTGIGASALVAFPNDKDFNSSCCLRFIIVDTLVSARRYNIDGTVESFGWGTNHGCHNERMVCDDDRQSSFMVRHLPSIRYLVVAIRPCHHCGMSLQDSGAFSLEISSSVFRFDACTTTRESLLLLSLPDYESGLLMPKLENKSKMWKPRDCPCVHS